MGMNIVDVSSLAKKEGRILIVVNGHNPHPDEDRTTFLSTVRDAVREMYSKDYTPESICMICKQLTDIGLLKIAGGNTWTTTGAGRKFVEDARGRADCQKFFLPSSSPNVPETSDTASS